MFPRQFGDGRCDTYCNNPRCKYDGGDCVQLCFADEYTNCSYDLFTNDVCDEGCNNEYCSGYEWKSDFVWPEVLDCEDQNGTFSCAADLHNCLIDLNSTDISVSNTNCSTSISDYLDIPLIYCKEQWLGGIKTIVSVYIYFSFCILFYRWIL